LLRRLRGAHLIEKAYRQGEGRDVDNSLVTPALASDAGTGPPDPDFDRIDTCHEREGLLWSVLLRDRRFS